LSLSQLKTKNNKQVLKLTDVIKGVDISLAGCINEFLSITSWIRIDTLTRTLDIASSNGIVLMQINYNSATSETSLVCSPNNNSNSSIVFPGFFRWFQIHCSFSSSDIFSSIYDNLTGITTKNVINLTPSLPTPILSDCNQGPHSYNLLNFSSANVSFRSNVNPGKYLSLDSTNCSAGNSPCGSFTSSSSLTANENFKLIRQISTSDIFCISSVANPNVYISFDSTTCVGQTNNGVKNRTCGTATAIYSTSGCSSATFSTFKLVLFDTNQWVVVSTYSSTAYLTFLTSGGGSLVGNAIDTFSSITATDDVVFLIDFINPNQSIYLKDFKIFRTFKDFSDLNVSKFKITNPEKNPGMIFYFNSWTSYSLNKFANMASHGFMYSLPPGSSFETDTNNSHPQFCIGPYLPSSLNQNSSCDSAQLIYSDNSLATFQDSGTLYSSISSGYNSYANGVDKTASFVLNFWMKMRKSSSAAQYTYLSLDNLLIKFSNDLQMTLSFDGFLWLTTGGTPCVPGLGIDNSTASTNSNNMYLKSVRDKWNHFQIVSTFNTLQNNAIVSLEINSSVNSSLICANVALSTNINKTFSLSFFPFITRNLGMYVLPVMTIKNYMKFHPRDYIFYQSYEFSKLFSPAPIYFFYIFEKPFITSSGVTAYVKELSSNSLSKLGSSSYDLSITSSMLSYYPLDTNDVNLNQFSTYESFNQMLYSKPRPSSTLSLKTSGGFNIANNLTIGGWFKVVSISPPATTININLASLIDGGSSNSFKFLATVKQGEVNWSSFITSNFMSGMVPSASSTTFKSTDMNLLSFDYWTYLSFSLHYVSGSPYILYYFWPSHANGSIDDEVFGKESSVTLNTFTLTNASLNVFDNTTSGISYYVKMIYLLQSPSNSYSFTLNDLAFLKYNSIFSSDFYSTSALGYYLFNNGSNNSVYDLVKGNNLIIQGTLTEFYSPYKDDYNYKYLLSNQPLICQAGFYNSGECVEMNFIVPDYSEKYLINLSYAGQGTYTKTNLNSLATFTNFGISFYMKGYFLDFNVSNLNIIKMSDATGILFNLIYSQPIIDANLNFITTKFTLGPTSTSGNFNTFDLNKWFNVIIQYVNVSNTVTLFIDSIQVASATLPKKIISVNTYSIIPHKMRYYTHYSSTTFDTFDIPNLLKLSHISMNLRDPFVSLLPTKITNNDILYTAGRNRATSRSTVLSGFDGNNVFLEKIESVDYGQRYIQDNININTSFAYLAPSLGTNTSISIEVWLRIFYFENTTNKVILLGPDSTKLIGFSFKLQDTVTNNFYIGCNYVSLNYISEYPVNFETWGHYACVFTTSPIVVNNNYSKTFSGLTPSVSIDSFTLPIFLDKTQSYFFFHNFRLWSSALSFDFINSNKYSTNANMILLYASLIKIAIENSVSYSDLPTQKLKGDLFPKTCGEKEIFNGLFCDKQKILDICSSTATITLMSNIIPTSFSSYTSNVALDFWVYVQNSNSVNYKIVESEIIWFEFTASAVKINNQIITGLSPSTLVEKWTHVAIFMSASSGQVYVNSVKYNTLSGYSGVIFTNLKLNRTTDNCAYLQQIKIWNFNNISNITTSLVSNMSRFNQFTSSVLFLYKKFSLTSSEEDINSSIIDQSQTSIQILLNSLYTDLTVSNPNYPTMKFFSNTSYTGSSNPSTTYLTPLVICPDNTNYSFDANLKSLHVSTLSK
jgi:hypothetical protein